MTNSCAPSTVLLTGASGNVGRHLRPMLRDRYDIVVLSSRKPITDLQENEKWKLAELDNVAQVDQLMAGVDAVIHLGGQAKEADWPSVISANVIGASNIFEAARRAGIQRVVFASSHHTMGMYARDKKTGSDSRPRPDTRYAVSKVMGEAMAAYYADKFGMRNLSIRIGSVNTEPCDLRTLSSFLHPEDLMQLVVLGLESDLIHNQVVYGVSDNSRSFWDNSVAYEIGYRPRHSADAFQSPGLLSEPPEVAENQVACELQGATYASREFCGDLDRTRQ